MAKNKKNKGGTKSKGKPKPKKQFQKAIGNSISSTIDNPFELRVNKSKHENLGRRSRNEQGVPGISRSRAIDKRKATLLQEYKVRNKSNSMQDKRIGEKRKGMPEEEKIIRRSAAEKARQFKQKSIFNLQDGEDLLTHKGKPLIDIDRYEDPRDESESEDERLDADFVSDANFGGFMKIKRAEDQPLDEEDIGEDGQPKSHKQIIQELIQASKKKKFEKAKEADENYELVCKLDDEFKTPDFRNLLLMGVKDKPTPEVVNNPADSDKLEYDKLVKQLQFETKTGRASDRLKTEEEVANEEKEKLEQLEKDRIRRMQMIDIGGGLKHRSADDLDDGFAIEEPKKSEDDDDEESDGEDGEEEEEADDSDASDEYSDMESDSETEKDVNNETGNKFTSLEENSTTQNKQAETEEFLEIPFVIGIPIKYKEFESMMKKHKAHYKSKNPSKVATLNVILSRMIKYNKASDRSRLPQVFNFTMRYLLEFAEASKTMTKAFCKTYETLMPHLHSLLILNPSGCVDAVEKGDIFDDFYPLKNLPFYKIIYFHICSQLFCCTDFHHKVLSSIKLKLSEVLSQHKATDVQSVVKILYVLRIMYKLSNESKRYSPEVINTLSSILNCYSGDELRSCGFIVPPLRPAKKLLFIKPESTNTSCEPDLRIWRLLSDVNSTSVFDVPQKLGILSVVLQYVTKFVGVCEKLPSSKEIFLDIRKVVLALKSRTDWPKSIFDQIEKTLTSIDSIKHKKEILSIAVSDKPKPLRLYEPLIEEDFDGMRKKKAPKGKQETARLAHKVKQETKNAVREIRKDTSFLAKQQLKEQLESDAQRKRKVKDILGSLANQEGDYQKSKRSKK